MKKANKITGLACTVLLIAVSCTDKKSSIPENPRAIESFEFRPNERDTINRTDSHGRKQGRWYVFMRFRGEAKDPAVLESGDYLDGMKQGYWVRRKKNGELIDSVLYRNDEAIY
jgi:hypothetical protein